VRFPGRIAALIAAAAMGAPAAAEAQTATVPRGGADISTTPPVPLPDSPPPNAPIRTQSVRDEQPVAASSLPSTGSDPRVLFLCGVALTLLGVGLRLRTADADLY
jgi:hypothetical protein